MAEFNYLASATTALGLIKKFGQPITISRKLGGDYDPIEGEVVGDSQEITTGEFLGAVLPASKGTLEAFDIRMEDGLTVDQVRFIILAAKDVPFRPEGTDQIEGLEDRNWIILGCTPLAPAGIPVIYKVGARLI